MKVEVKNLSEVFNFMLESKSFGSVALELDSSNSKLGVFELETSFIIPLLFTMELLMTNNSKKVYKIKDEVNGKSYLVYSMYDLNYENIFNKDDTLVMTYADLNSVRIFRNNVLLEERLKEDKKKNKELLVSRFEKTIEMLH